VAQIPPREQVAVRNALLKLHEFGPTLPFPHSRVRCKTPTGCASFGQGRETARGVHSTGNSATCLWVAAVGPEAQVKPRDFVRAVSDAEQRLKKLEADE